jgi:hypothetical protein
VLGDEGPDLDEGEDVLDGPGIGVAAVGGRHRRSRRCCEGGVCRCVVRVVSAATEV